VHLEHPTFAAFWEAYPRKVGKGAARKAYAAAIRRGTPEQLLAAVKAQCMAGDQYTPHPTTWLNQDRWLDETTTHHQRGPNPGQWDRNLAL